jgi:hypothetical protein
MSMYGTRCEIFEKVLASLIDQQPWIDGLDLADILQRAATKVMKESLSGLDGDARDRYRATRVGRGATIPGDRVAIEISYPT